MLKIILPVLAAVFMGLAVPAQAQTDTLDKIKKTGRVLVGHRDSSVPFSYLVEARISDFDETPPRPEVVGYSQDHADLIVEAIKKELGLPGLRVEYVPITSKNRIELLSRGGYDFECGSTTNNYQRQAEAAFSNTIFVAGTRFLVNKDSGLTEFEDLAGKTVVVTVGTTTARLIEVMDDQEKLGLKIIQAPNHRESFLELESGRADAFFLDDALLAGERTRAKNPDQWVFMGLTQTFEAYGCMLRKDDPGLKELIDQVIGEAQTSGRARELFDKWFQAPIPPDGANLNFALPVAMERLFAAPNDLPYQ